MEIILDIEIVLIMYLVIYPMSLKIKMKIIKPKKKIKEL